MGGPCEKALGAASMPNGVSSYLLQDGLATGQSQAKAEPTGSTSAIMYFRQGKKFLQSSWERGMRKSEWNSPADTKLGAEREEVLQVLGQRFPAATGTDHGESGCPPATLGDPPAAREEPHSRTTECVLKEDTTCGDPSKEKTNGRSWRKASRRAGFLAGHVIQWKTSTGAAHPWGTDTCEMDLH